MKRGIPLVLVSCLPLAGCVLSPRFPSGPELIYRSGPSRPGWITRLPASDEFFYATGIATRASYLEEAKRQAVAAAVEEVVNYLGMRTSVRYEEITTELTTRVLNQIETSARARVGRAGLAEMYYEQYRDLTGGSVVSTFDSYVLLRIPQSELARERERLAQEKVAQAAQVRVLMKSAKTDREQGRWMEAFQTYVSALGLADDLADRALTAQILMEAEFLIRGLSLEMQEIVDKESKGKTPTRLLISAFLLSDPKKVPLIRLPLKVRFVEGSGLLGEAVITNAQGEARVRIDRVDFPDRRNVLEGEVDMEGFLAGVSQGSPSFQEKLQNLRSRLRTRRALFVFPGSGRDPSKEPPAVPIAAKAFPPSALKGDVKLRIKTDRKYFTPGENVFIAIKLELVASEVEYPARPSLNLALVMDRSGSMEEAGKLEFTKKAARLLVENLDRGDSLAFVTFDTGVEVLSPSAPLTNRLLLEHKIDEIDSGGTTNLSGGLFEGYTQVTRMKRKELLNRILLLSDGIANVGITDEEALLQYARKYAKSGVSITTIGVGSEYNEDLMLNLAEYSGGNYYFVKNPEDLPAIFRRELKGLLPVVAQNIAVELTIPPNVNLVNAYGTPYETRFYDNGDETIHTEQFRLGDLMAGKRKILLIELELLGSDEGEVLLTDVLVGFDDLLDHSGRREHREAISVIATRDRTRVKRSEDQEVNSFIKIAQIAETFDLVIKSMDAGLHEKAHKLLANEYKEVHAFATKMQNRELMERAALVKHFADELEEIEETRSLHGHDESVKELRKDLQYKKYLLQHHRED